MLTLSSLPRAHGLLKETERKNEEKVVAVFASVSPAVDKYLFSMHGASLTSLHLCRLCIFLHELFFFVFLCFYFRHGIHSI